jgi:uncharacterized protein
MDVVLDSLERFASATLELGLKAAPWLVFGLVVAGVVRAWLPDRLVAKWLGGGGMGGAVRAALIGTPLPLCSCGVVPAAVGLRRGGASKSSTVSFLVATPENGADSIALSYALLGPVFAVVRPVAAFICAVTAGLLTIVFGDRADNHTPAIQEDEAAGSSSCGSAPAGEPAMCCDARVDAVEEQTSCCATDAVAPEKVSLGEQLGEGLSYSFGKLLDDLMLWLVIGLAVSGAILAFVEPGTLREWGSGPLALVVMAFVGVPMYVCATAATPIAAGLIAAGVSPGAALVLLLAGPATNLGTIGIVKKELGTPALLGYLVGVVPLSILMGWLFNLVLERTEWSVDVGEAMGHEMMPGWLRAGALAVLVVFGVRPLRRAVLAAVGRVLPG